MFGQLLDDSGPRLEPRAQTNENAESAWPTHSKGGNDAQVSTHESALPQVKILLTTHGPKSTPEYVGEASLIVHYVWWKNGTAFCFDIPDANTY